MLAAGKNIVLNMDQVTYLDSAGLGALAATARGRRTHRWLSNVG